MLQAATIILGENGSKQRPGSDRSKAAPASLAVAVPVPEPAIEGHGCRAPHRPRRRSFYQDEIPARLSD